MKAFFSGLGSFFLGLFTVVAIINGIWGFVLLFYLDPALYDSPKDIPRWEWYMWFPVGEWILFGAMVVSTVLVLLGEKMRGNLD
jgi:hypothetical protein